jgi:transcriptional regulator with XRE-family HTH domain
MAVGSRIREERKAQRRTLQQVADGTGVSVAALSMIERDQRPNPGLSTLVALARMLDLEIVVTRRGVAVGSRRKQR